MSDTASFGAPSQGESANEYLQRRKVMEELGEIIATGYYRGHQVEWVDGNNREPISCTIDLHFGRVTSNMHYENGLQLGKRKFEVIAAAVDLAKSAIAQHEERTYGKK